MRLEHRLALASLVFFCASCHATPRTDDVRSVRRDLERRVPLLSDAGEPLVAAQVNELLASPLDEATALRIALARNPDVREGYERLGVARYELLQAGLLKNPTLAADAKFFSGGPEIEFGLTQPLMDLLFVRHRAAIAQAERRIVEADVSANLVELIFAIRRRLIQLQAAERVVSLHQDAVATADATRDLFAKLYEAGNILDQAHTSGEIAASRARLELAAAEATERERRESLRRLLGLDDGAPRIELAAGLAEDLPPSPVEADVERDAERASLELAGMHAAMLAAQRGRSYAAVRRSTWFRDGGVVGKRESGDGSWGFGPALGVELPLFDPGSAECGRASAAFRRATALAAATRLDVRSAARRLATRAGLAAEREQQMRTEYLPLRKRYVSDLIGRYNQMQIGAFEVLEAQLMEFSARREHAEMLRDAWLARTDVDELLAGHLNRDRLEAPAMPDEADHPAISGGGH